jgi:hypothetical protein
MTSASRPTALPEKVSTGSSVLMQPADATVALIASTVTIHLRRFVMSFVETEAGR